MRALSRFTGVKWSKLLGHSISRRRFTSNVLYFDRQVLVLNKPPGLASQLGPESVREIMTTNNLAGDLYPVHRLDKDVSGCLVFARTLQVAQELSRQLRSRSAEKTYLALLRGGSQTFKEKSGRIEAALRTTDGNVSLAERTSDGKHTFTDYEILTSSSSVPVSLASLRLHTGHRHQLRIHMAKCLGAPILGDSKYSQKPVTDSIARRHPDLSRIYLHSSSFSFWRYRKSGPSKKHLFGIHCPLSAGFLETCSKLDVDVPPELAGGKITIDREPLSVQDSLLLTDLQASWLHDEPE